MPKKKILIVDDSNTVLLLCQLMLKEWGYELVTARNGREAVEKALTEAPDLIFMDVAMPEMDGLEACRSLRARAETQATPILFMTTRDEPYDVHAFSAPPGTLLALYTDGLVEDPALSIDEGIDRLTGAVSSVHPWDGLQQAAPRQPGAGKHPAQRHAQHQRDAGGDAGHAQRQRQRRRVELGPEIGVHGA